MSSVRSTEPLVYSLVLYIDESLSFPHLVRALRYLGIFICPPGDVSNFLMENSIWLSAPPAYEAGNGIGQYYLLYAYTEHAPILN